MRWIVLPAVVALVAIGSPAVSQESGPTPSTSPEPTSTSDVSQSPADVEPSQAPQEREERTEAELTPAENDVPPSPTPRKGTGLLDALLPAAVGDGLLSVTLTQKTGTGPFDADNAPGHDSGADNDVVRTNDTIAYTVGLRYEGEDQTKPTITFALPKGEELVSLPPFCKAGSAVTPTSLPEPAVPVTTTSWESLPIQTVTCVVADQSQGTALNYSFVSKVRSEVPDGTQLSSVTASATSDQVTDPAESESVSHRVSAKARFDVSKRATAAAWNQGPLYAQTRACHFDSSQVCREISYPLTISASDAGKGSSPLASPITLQDDLTPATFFGASVWAEAVALAGSESAAVAAYAPRLVECANVEWLALASALPYSSLAGGGNTGNSVRDSGSISCAQSGGAGNAVDITINDADTSAYTVPSTAGRGAALPADSAYVVSRRVVIEVPQKAVAELGESNQDGTVQTLSVDNHYTDVEMTDIAGAANAGEVLGNNDRTASIILERLGTFTKFFSGVFGAAGNTSAYGFMGISSWEGPPGSGTGRDGNTVVLDKQAVQSNLSFVEKSVAGSGTTYSRTVVGCDVWDESTLALAANNAWKGNNDTYPSRGKPVWVSRHIAGTVGLPGDAVGTPASPAQNLKVEYSSGPAGSGAASDCSGGTWYSEPNDVPGSASTTGSNGTTTWTGVNRVRVSFATNWSGSVEEVNVGVTISQIVKDNGTDNIIGNWASYKATNGIMSAEDALADNSSEYRLSGYNPATHAGTWGDRLNLVKAVARIKMYVKNPVTGEFVDSAIPEYSSGSRLQYRLSPTLTADAQSTGSTTAVFVEDCLPPYQQFVSSSRAGSGDPITPALVTEGAPDDSEISCAAGQQYVRWDLGTLQVGAAIDPIIVEVDILDTAGNGTYTSTTLVSADGDPSAASRRDDDVQLQLVVPTGIKIAKSTPQNIVEVNPVGVADPRKLRWTVQFANIDDPQTISNVDVIDVLPADGQHGNDFTGSLAFDEAVVAKGTDIQILYTKTPTPDLSADGNDPSNAAAGATLWCDAATGGAVVSGSGAASNCPASPAEVTGLRFLRPGEFDPADQFAVDIVMTPSGNSGGDVYRNITGGRADGVSQPVGPAAREISIISSQVGNYVWEDLNSNGLQDDGEPVVKGFEVKLVGEDLDGNPVTLTTTTDADGKYSFAGLASGNYRVIFDPNSLTSNSKFTTKDAGSDDTVDSDADPTTGEAAEFALAPDSSDSSWDAGLVIDRNVEITVDKRLVSQSEPDSENRATVTYEVEVANAGTAEGVYDLSDKLKFGGSIVIDEVSASNTVPGDVVVNPDFDGIGDTKLVEEQKLAGGKSHVYQVVVEATVNTAISAEQRNCTLTETEEGTGYLNEAQLTVDGVTQTDVACGTPEKPETPEKPGTPEKPKESDVGNGNETKNDDDGLLPNTGGPALWLIGLSGAALLAGALSIGASRRPERVVRRR